MKDTLVALKRFNDRFAIGLSNLYGNPLLIWVSIAFSISGAFVTDVVLGKMTYWSNAAQLIFCFVSVYTALLNLKAHKEMKAGHEEHAKKIDEIHKVLVGKK